MIYNSKTLIEILDKDLDLDSISKLEFQNKIWADRNLEHKCNV